MNRVAVLLLGVLTSVAGSATQTPGSLKDWCFRSPLEDSGVIPFPVNINRQRERLDTLISDLQSQIDKSAVRETNSVSTLLTLKRLLETLPYTSSHDRHLFFHGLSLFSIVSQRTTNNLIRKVAIESQKDLLKNNDLVRRYILLDLQYAPFNSYRFPFRALTQFSLTSFAAALHGSTLNRLQEAAPAGIQEIAVEGLVALTGKLIQAGVVVDRFYQDQYSCRSDLQSEIRQKLLLATQNASDVKVRLRAKRGLLQMERRIAEEQFQDIKTLRHYVNVLTRE